MSAISESPTDQRFDGSGGPRKIGPADGRLVDIQSAGVRFMAWSEETGGGFSLVEHPIPPHGLVAPLHKHSREDEYSYVLEGRMGALLGDDVVHAEVGDLVFKPRNQWHTFWNAGDRALPDPRDHLPRRVRALFRSDGGGDGLARLRPATDGRARRPLRARNPARQHPGAVRRARTHAPDAPGQPLTRRLARCASCARVAAIVSFPRLTRSGRAVSRGSHGLRGLAGCRARRGAPSARARIRGGPRPRCHGRRGPA